MADTSTLLLMRHAEAAAGLMGTDRERDLTSRGEEQARLAGTRLAGLGQIDLALVSTSVRTRQTLDAMIAGGLKVGRVEERDDIYEAMVPSLLRAVRSADPAARSVLVIGHAPGIPGLATVLANDPAAPYPTVRMPKGFAPATVVHLVTDRAWADLDGGQAQVVEILTPVG